MVPCDLSIICDNTVLGAWMTGLTADRFQEMRRKRWDTAAGPAGEKWKEKGGVIPQ